MNRQELIDRVVVDPKICGGQPVIRGTRIMIAMILDGIADGMTAEQIIDYHPHLTVDDVRGTVDYPSQFTRNPSLKTAV